MPASFPVPIQEDIRDLLMDLLGRGTAVDKVQPLLLDDDQPAVIAEYRTDDGTVGAICLVDAEFAIRTAGALTMVPPAAVADTLRNGDVSESLENFREIVNILASLLNSPKTSHLRLGGVHVLPGEMPDGVASLVARPEFRRDFAVQIEGYGSGRLSLLVN
ncbi:MAG TPA: hypothetical protein VEG38_05490, partial [Acidimicrobiia bacterium]|nr:hypothetical protein [Acidimicrobiia bacterium]